MEGLVKAGFFWHVHHNVLVEFCYGYDERKEFIRTEKEEHEREVRLRLFQPVKGSLPQEVVEAWQAYIEAGRACDKAWQAYEKAGRARNEAWRVREEAWEAYDEVGLAYRKAGIAYNEALNRNMVAIEELHKKECPNCPWNGKTIFP